MNQNLITKWVVAQIKPNSCDLAVRNLERQGFETFLPKMNSTIIKENKFINKDVLVFPGYIFVGIDLQNYNWKKINSTYGVHKLLVFNYKPAEISNDVILVLKNNYQANTNSIIRENLRNGDTIRFNNGPFVDLIANIENVDEKKRIYVLLKVMGGSRKLEINLKEKINFNKI